jgi:hypothetical protein
LPLFQKGVAPRILGALDALIESKREVPVEFKTATTVTTNNSIAWLKARL